MDKNEQPQEGGTIEGQAEALDFDVARGAKAETPAAVPMARELQGPVVKDDGTALGFLAAMTHSGRDIESIKQLMDLRDREEKYQAEKVFDREFANMQAEFKPIPRSKTARDNDKNRDLYDYAPIEEYIKINGAVIAAHGFSYYFSEELLPDGKVKRFYLHVKGWGFTRTTFVDLPVDGSKAPLMNAAQASRSLQSYGQRYALVAGFGFVAEDADDDAGGPLGTFDEGVELGLEIQAIQNSTRQNLKENYAEAIRDKTPRQMAILAAVRGKLVAKFTQQDAESTR